MLNKKKSNPVYNLGTFEDKAGNIARKITVTVTSTVVTKEDERIAKKCLEHVYDILLKKMEKPRH